MKHLNVKWVPETFAIVTLTVGAPPQAIAAERTPANPLSLGEGSVCTKLIVISGGTELTANVTAMQRRD